MCLPESIATSSALIDLGRPTNSGITMCGNTTTSRNGRSGSSVTSEEEGRSMAMQASEGRNGAPKGKNVAPEGRNALPKGKTWLPKGGDLTQHGALEGCCQVGDKKFIFVNGLARRLQAIDIIRQTGAQPLRHPPSDPPA